MLKANWYKAYDCLCRVIISFFVNQSIDELTKGEWMRSKQELWKWVRLLSIGETRHILRILAQYECHVATHDLDFGGDRYGVYLCTPTDLMHAYLLGVVCYAVETMMKPLPPLVKEFIENQINQVIKVQQQTS